MSYMAERLEAELADTRDEYDMVMSELKNTQAELADLRASSVVYKIREIPRSELKPGDVYASRISRQEDDNKTTVFVRHVDSVWLIEGVTDEDV